MQGDHTNHSSEQERRERARQRVAEIKGFYTHLIIFIGVLAVLFAINVTSGGSWWIQWVFLGWGIGVAAHAFAIFGRTPGFISRWEKRKIEEYMNEQ